MTPGVPSATTRRAIDFVAAHARDADSLGAELADHVTDPQGFTALLEQALSRLADDEYRAGQAFVAPGIGPTIGVRNPLLARLRSSFTRASRGASSADLLLIADRLLASETLEPRWFAYAVLGRVLATDPERSWQLLRRAARDASDWISVDTLAHAYATGIVTERYRWAELEQLVYSPSRWERRLVGSTIATIPFVDRRVGRELDVARRGLALVGDLIGDAEPDVQKALSWALRSLVLVDRDAVTAFCGEQTGRATETDDGHRAWVIRDTLPKLDPAIAAALRATLSGVRRRPGAPSTSRAAETASRFSSLGLGRRLPEPPPT